MRRKSLRRSLRAGSTVRRSTPGEMTTMLAPILDEAYAVRGIPSGYGPNIGAEVEAWAATSPDVYLGTALVDGEPAGVLVGFAVAGVAYAWAGGCFRRFRDADPNVPLHVDLFEWAIALGCHEVDLCGRVDEGVERFKLAFGGSLRGYRAAESLVVPGTVRRLGQRLTRV